MRQLPNGGAMLAVQAPFDQVLPHVEAEPLAAVAAHNGPRDVVVSGDADAVGRIGDALVKSGAAVSPLPVSHAFHSPLMRPMVASFSRVTARLPVRTLAVPIASSMHGRFVTSEELDSRYWVEQVTAPVRFDAALRAALELAPTHLIEIGPAPVLLGLARRAGVGHEVAGLVPCPGEDATGQEIAEVLAALYRGGLNPRWDSLYTKSQRVPWRLPPYVFNDETRFWTSPVTARTATASSTASPAEDAAGDDTDDPVGSQTLAALAELGDYPVQDLREDARLREDLGYDSITLMRLSDRLMAILRTDEPLPVAELLPRLTTVGDVLSYVSDRSTAS
jgi:acyl transferase domain-containing protein